MAQISQQWYQKPFSAFQAVLDYAIELKKSNWSLQYSLTLQWYYPETPYLRLEIHQPWPKSDYDGVYLIAKLHSTGKFDYHYVFKAEQTINMQENITFQHQNGVYQEATPNFLHFIELFIKHFDKTNFWLNYTYTNTMARDSSFLNLRQQTNDLWKNLKAKIDTNEINYLLSLELNFKAQRSSYNLRGSASDTDWVEWVSICKKQGKLKNINCLLVNNEMQTPYRQLKDNLPELYHRTLQTIKMDYGKMLEQCWIFAEGLLKADAVQNN